MTPGRGYASRAGYEVRNPDGDRLVVLLHGLGAERSQPVRLLGETFREWCVLAPDARAHGATAADWTEDALRFPAMAEDVIDLVRALRLDDRPIYVAGISMGAAIGLRLLLDGGLPIAGAAFIRPAFTDAPDPGNLASMPIVADLLTRHGAVEGERLFAAGAEYRAVRSVSESGAAGELGQFRSPRAAERAARLRAVARNAAFERAELAGVAIPTLVVGADRDPEHPLEIARMWADLLPAAELAVVPARDDDRVAYETAIAAAVGAHAARAVETARC